MNSENRGTVTLTSSEMLDALLRKYSLLRQEIPLQIGFYKGHVRNFQLLGTAILGGSAYAFSQPSLLPKAGYWWPWWMLTTFIPIVANYLILDIVEAQYATILLGERLATIEEEVNRLAGRRLLIWETLVVPRFWQDFRPIPGVINPDWLLGILGLLIATIVSVVLPIFVYWQLLWPTAATLYMCVAVIAGGIFAAVCTLMSGICMYKVNLRLRNKPRLLIRELAKRPLSSEDR